jgi:hypothetical protein
VSVDSGAPCDEGDLDADADGSALDDAFDGPAGMPTLILGWATSDVPPESGVFPSTRTAPTPSAATPARMPKAAPTGNPGRSPFGSSDGVPSGNSGGVK